MQLVVKVLIAMSYLFNGWAIYRKWHSSRSACRSGYGCYILYSSILENLFSLAGVELPPGII